MDQTPFTRSLCPCGTPSKRCCRWASRSASRWSGRSRPSHDVSGIIGFNGDVGGSVVLSFPFATAQHRVRVHGHAGGRRGDGRHRRRRRRTGQHDRGAPSAVPGRTVSISCPSVIVGENHTVQCARRGCVLLPAAVTAGVSRLRSPSDRSRPMPRVKAVPGGLPE